MRAPSSAVLIALAAWLAMYAITAAQNPPPQIFRVPNLDRPSAEAVPTPATLPAATPRPTSPLSAAAPIEVSKEKREYIARRIRDLDAAEFLTRETAMIELLQSGPAVLPALKPVLMSGSLEGMSRGLFIVRQVGLAADFDGQDLAGQLLAELSQQKEIPALARRAAAELVGLTDERSTRALTELEHLGAKIARSQFAGGFVLDESALSVELGQAFRGDEHDLRRLKWVIDVPILILSGEHVTDAWIKEAVAMPGLEELHLYQAKISDAGLGPLAEHPSLKQLGIYHTAVHDEALAPLAKLPLLSFVKLYGTKITNEGVEKFKTASGAAVDFRRGAFLGVGGHDDTDGCRITTVHRGSPAEKAGILPNDIVTRFGGQPVTNFSGLTDLIAPREFGEEVEVELGREELAMRRTITVKVTLAAWEADTAVQNRRPR